MNKDKRNLIETRKTKKRQTQHSKSLKIAVMMRNNTIGKEIVKTIQRGLVRKVKQIRLSKPLLQKIVSICNKNEKEKSRI